MKIYPGQKSILLTNVIALLIFSVLYVSHANYEFLLYIGVIIFFLALIFVTNKKIRFSNSVLWGLTVWSVMHMAGGFIPVGDGVLYELILIPFTSDIFRYDQLVHIIGFGTATLVMFELIKPLLSSLKSHPVRLGIVVVMAGLGVGAVNEIIEFIATVLVPETGVGGYFNTSLDLVADLIGAILAWIWIYRRY